MRFTASSEARRHAPSRINTCVRPSYGAKENIGRAIAGPCCSGEEGAYAAQASHRCVWLGDARAHARRRPPSCRTQAAAGSCACGSVCVVRREVFDTAAGLDRRRSSSSPSTLLDWQRRSPTTILVAHTHLKVSLEVAALSFGRRTAKHGARKSSERRSHAAPQKFEGESQRRRKSSNGARTHAPSKVRRRMKATAPAKVEGARNHGRPKYGKAKTAPPSRNFGRRTKPRAPKSRRRTQKPRSPQEVRSATKPRRPQLKAKPAALKVGMAKPRRLKVRRAHEPRAPQRFREAPRNPRALKIFSKAHETRRPQKFEGARKNPRRPKMWKAKPAAFRSWKRRNHAALKSSKAHETTPPQKFEAP